jgi:SagB-type dehydrogenase family enzyme
MRQRTIRLRRARCLFAYWQNGQLCFHNFAKRLTVSGKPITCEILAFFDRWRTCQEAITHFAEYTQRSVRSALAQSVEHGLLLRNDSPELTRDSRIANEWSAWLPQGSFHFCTKDAVYVDRSNWSSSRLKAILPKTPQPKIFKTVKGAMKTTLPRRVFPDSEFVRVLMGRKTHRQFSKQQLPLETVSQLLSLVWGVNGYLYSPRFGKLLQKTSPSAGARHPGEVYLMALRVKGLSPGLYHYHPGHHCLETIRTDATREKAWLYCARQHFVRNAAALFLMTAVFRRTMWKYQHPRAYRVVLLDAGHLCQTFCLVATWLGSHHFAQSRLRIH